MARITLNGSTPGGKLLRLAISNLMTAQQQLVRAKLIADQVTDGGTQTANLESAGEFEAGAGQGTTVYADIQSLKVAADGLLTTIAKYDQVQ